jgi:hypothetical protein
MAAQATATFWFVLIPLRFRCSGKTSLMLRFSEDKFSSSLLATAGVDYKTQFLDIEGKRVKCQIWYGLVAYNAAVVSFPTLA